jgi:hypothetical protein
MGKLKNIDTLFDDSHFDRGAIVLCVRCVCCTRVTSWGYAI